MTLRAAPFWPKLLTGDGVTTDFLIPFPILDPTHLNVLVGVGSAGVLKTLGTDYVILTQSTDKGLYKTWTVSNSGSPIIRFLPTKIPAATSNNIQLFRNTPIARPSPANGLQVGPDTALYAHFRKEEQDDLALQLPFFFSATNLAAHTSQVITAPCDGYITGIQTDVTEVITTGGTVGANIESTAVTGMVVTIANSAAAGKQQSAVPTTQQASYTIVKRGQQLSITATSFATAGAVAGYLTFQPADLATYG